MLNKSKSSIRSWQTWQIWKIQIKIRQYSVFSTFSDRPMRTLRQPQNGIIFEKFLVVKNCSKQPPITESLKAESYEKYIITCKFDFCFFWIFIFSHRPKITFFIEVLDTWGHNDFAHFGPMPIIISWKSYFTTLSNLKLNNSKTTNQILTNLTVLEHIDKTTFVDHIADILRLPARMSRQP